MRRRCPLPFSWPGVCLARLQHPQAPPATLSLTWVPPLSSLSSPQGGGVRVNNGKVDDELATLAEGDLIDGRLVLIAAGKKNKMLVRVAA